VDLGHGDWQAVPLPGLLQQVLEAGGAPLDRAQRQHVDVAVAAVPADRHAGVALHPLVEEPLAREVVVDPDDVRRARVGQEFLELALRDRVREVAPQRVVPVHAARQEVEAEPAALVLVGRLVGEVLRGERPAQVLGLDEAGGGVHPADGAHGAAGRVRLVHHHAQEEAVVAGVRVPVAVEAAEPGRRQRLVDRRVELQPGVALGHPRGVLGEAGGEARPGESGVAGAAAVVDQPRDRGQAEPAQAAEPLVRPAPVGAPGAVRGDPLPQHRVADGPDAQRGEVVEVARAVLVAAQHGLVDVAVADPGDGALEPAPHLERRGLGRRGATAGALRHAHLGARTAALPRGVSVCGPSAPRTPVTSCNPRRSAPHVAARGGANGRRPRRFRRRPAGPVQSPPRRGGRAPRGPT
jgi:hypothetical protein